MKLISKLVIAAFAATGTTAMADTVNQGYVVNNNGVVMSGTGLCWRSGDWTAQRAVEPCDASRKPVAAAAPYAEPKAIVVAAAAPAPLAEKAIQKLTFDADALFDMDKSSLRPAGRRSLDNFVGRIKDINPEAIMVVGHASRPGTEKHNQTLSEERAQAVKTYLVSAGIAADRVRTSGKGETQPVTGTYECLNDKSDKAIACRQPDRRVEIELIGARIPR
jgi:OOP family OmpA-OmpF porin